MKITFPFYLTLARQAEQKRLGLSFTSTPYVRIAPILALGRFVKTDEGIRHAKISIQASLGLECDPSSTVAYHMYTSFEVGMVDIHDELLGNHYENVYPFVPAENLQKYIDHLGGIVGYYTSASEFINLELSQEDITYFLLNNS